MAGGYFIGLALEGAIVSLGLASIPAFIVAGAISALIAGILMNTQAGKDLVNGITENLVKPLIDSIQSKLHSFFSLFDSNPSKYELVSNPSLESSDYKSLIELLLDSKSNALDIDSLLHTFPNYLAYLTHTTTDTTNSLSLSNATDSIPVIKPKDIELIISKSVHIPKTQVNRDESKVLKNLEKTLKKRIFSQDKAITEVVRVIKKNKAGLGESNKPIGSFVFAGPSGVGKTELSIELAKALGIAFVKFDMSEYMEPHSISRLIGAPAGYVGFEQGGLLVDSIRKHPYCVLLLDEIEKAHSDIYNVLLQVLDAASLTDNAGNRADFKNVIVIMTSNAGSKEGNALGFNADNKGKSEGAIKHLFSPEFRSRLDGVVHFSALGVEEYRLIAQKYLEDLNENLASKNIELLPDSKALQYLANQSVDNALGAREIRRLIDTQIKLPLSDEILFGKLKKGGKVKITTQHQALHLQVLTHS